jgi:DNA-binding NarL/FixJ family response regulator
MDASRGRCESLTGRRILLVEDSFLVSLSLARMLRVLGCEVVGPFAEVGEARAAAIERPVDAAVLDINLIGGSGAAVAEALAERQRPFVLVTGYAPSVPLQAPLRSAPRLCKPVEEHSLHEALAAILA